MNEFISGHVEHLKARGWTFFTGDSGKIFAAAKEIAEQVAESKVNVWKDGAVMVAVAKQG